MTDKTFVIVKHDNPIAATLRAIEEQLNGAFVKRSDVIRVQIVSALAQRHYLLAGAAGTGKTATVTAFLKHVKGGTRFKALLGAFTPPEAVWGPMDIAAFKAGTYRHVTTGMAPESEMPFFDEFLKGSDALVNTFLGYLQDREFMGETCPLISAGTATNWPEVETRSDKIEALFDRTLLRVAVQPLTTKEDKAAMLRKADMLDNYTPKATVTIDELRAAHEEVRKVEIDDAVIDMMLNMADVITKGSHGMYISDRRLAQLQIALRANAWLEGRMTVTVEDFEMLRYGLWSYRKDVAEVNAAIDMVDQEEVRAAIAEIDKARQAYRQVEQAGFGSAKINKASETIKAVALDIKTRLSKPVFTKSGRGKVRDQMKLLKDDFEKLSAKAKSHSA